MDAHAGKAKRKKLKDRLTVSFMIDMKDSKAMRKEDAREKRAFGHKCRRENAGNTYRRKLYSTLHATKGHRSTGDVGAGSASVTINTFVGVRYSPPVIYAADEGSAIVHKVRAGQPMKTVCHRGIDAATAKMIVRDRARKKQGRWFSGKGRSSHV